jgi:ferredoxin
MSELVTGPADELRQEEAGLLACVHCGFCLNACPTYRRLGHEGDSPRGRLDLMRAVVEGRLDADDDAFHNHIDRCLGCRACEPVCPSGVPYGFLLERARVAMAETKGISISTRLLIAAYTSPLLPLVTTASRVMRATGLAALLARILPRGLGFPLAMLASTRAWRGLRRNGTSTAAPRGGTAPAMEPAPGSVADDMASPTRTVADPHALMGAYPRSTGSTTVRNRTEAPGAATASRTAAGGAAPARRTRVALLDGCVQE